MKIEFLNGPIIDTNDTAAYIAFLKYIGWEKLRPLALEYHGRPIFYNKFDSSPSYAKTQIEIAPGIYFNSMCSRSRKYSVINRVAKAYNLQLTVNDQPLRIFQTSKE